MWLIINQMHLIKIVMEREMSAIRNLQFAIYWA